MSPCNSQEHVDRDQNHNCGHHHLPGDMPIQYEIHDRCKAHCKQKLEPGYTQDRNCRRQYVPHSQHGHPYRIPLVRQLDIEYTQSRNQDTAHRKIMHPGYMEIGIGMGLRRKQRNKAKHCRLQHKTACRDYSQKNNTGHNFPRLNHIFLLPKHLIRRDSLFCKRIISNHKAKICQEKTDPCNSLP